MPEVRPTRAELTLRTRDRIAAAAMDLFATHGYPTVSVAAVARAAGVTEKTVFNHFGTKAELVYSNDQPFEQALLDAVATRVTGESVVEAVSAFLLDRYARMLTHVGSRDRQALIARLVASSRDLRDHEAHVLDRYADSLAGELAEELHSDAADLRPRVVAQSLMAVHRAVVTGFRGQHGDDEVVEAARQAFTLLSTGLRDFGRRTHHTSTPAEGSVVGGAS